MSLNLGFAAALALTAVGFFLWLYRRGKAAAMLGAVRDELRKISRIQSEAKKIDQSAAKNVQDLDRNPSDHRSFWVRRD